MCFDLKSFSFADGVFDAMETAVRESRYTLMIVSEEYFSKGSHSSREAEWAITADRGVPLFLVDPKTAPQRVRSIIGVDLRNEALLADQWRRLLEQLGAPDPSAPPPLHVGHDSLANLPEPVRTPPRRSRWPMAAGLLALVAIAIGLGVWLFRGPGRDHRAALADCDAGGVKACARVVYERGTQPANVRAAALLRWALLEPELDAKGIRALAAVLKVVDPQLLLPPTEISAELDKAFVDAEPLPGLRIGPDAPPVLLVGPEAAVSEARTALAGQTEPPIRTQRITEDLDLDYRFSDGSNLLTHALAVADLDAAWIFGPKESLLVARGERFEAEVGVQLPVHRPPTTDAGLDEGVVYLRAAALLEQAQTAFERGDFSEAERSFVAFDSVCEDDCRLRSAGDLAFYIYALVSGIDPGYATLRVRRAMNRPDRFAYVVEAAHHLIGQVQTSSGSDGFARVPKSVRRSLSGRAQERIALLEAGLAPYLRTNDDVDSPSSADDRPVMATNEEASAPPPTTAAVIESLRAQGASNLALLIEATTFVQADPETPRNYRRFYREASRPEHRGAVAGSSLLLFPRIFRFNPEAAAALLEPDGADYLASLRDVIEWEASRASLVRKTARLLALLETRAALPGTPAAALHDLLDAAVRGAFSDVWDLGGQLPQLYMVLFNPPVQRVLVSSIDEWSSSPSTAEQAPRWATGIQALLGVRRYLLSEYPAARGHFLKALDVTLTGTAKPSMRLARSVSSAGLALIEAKAQQWTRAKSRVQQADSELAAFVEAVKPSLSASEFAQVDGLARLASEAARMAVDVARGRQAQGDALKALVKTAQSLPPIAPDGAAEPASYRTIAVRAARVLAFDALFYADRTTNSKTAAATALYEQASREAVDVLTQVETALKFEPYGLEWAVLQLAQMAQSGLRTLDRTGSADASTAEILKTIGPDVSEVIRQVAGLFSEAPATYLAKMRDATDEESRLEGLGVAALKSFASSEQRLADPFGKASLAWAQDFLTNARRHLPPDPKSVVAGLTSIGSVAVETLGDNDAAQVARLLIRARNELAATPLSGLAEALEHRAVGALRVAERPEPAKALLDEMASNPNRARLAILLRRAQLHLDTRSLTSALTDLDEAARILSTAEGVLQRWVVPLNAEGSTTVSLSTERQTDSGGSPIANPVSRLFTQFKRTWSGGRVVTVTVDMDPLLAVLGQSPGTFNVGIGRIWARAPDGTDTTEAQVDLTIDDAAASRASPLTLAYTVDLSRAALLLSSGQLAEGGRALEQALTIFETRLLQNGNLVVSRDEFSASFVLRVGALADLTGHYELARQLYRTVEVILLPDQREIFGRSTSQGLAAVLNEAPTPFFWTERLKALEPTFDAVLRLRYGAASPFVPIDGATEGLPAWSKPLLRAHLLNTVSGRDEVRAKAFARAIVSKTRPKDAAGQSLRRAIQFDLEGRQHGAAVTDALRSAGYPIGALDRFAVAADDSAAEAKLVEWIEAVALKNRYQKPLVGILASRLQARATESIEAMQKAFIPYVLDITPVRRAFILPPLWASSDDPDLLTRTLRAEVLRSWTLPDGINLVILLALHKTPTDRDSVARLVRRFRPRLNPTDMGSWWAQAIDDTFDALEAAGTDAERAEVIARFKTTAAARLESDFIALALENTEGVRQRKLFTRLEALSMQTKNTRAVQDGLSIIASTATSAENRLTALDRLGETLRASKDEADQPRFIKNRLGSARLLSAMKRPNEALKRLESLFAWTAESGVQGVTEARIDAYRLAARIAEAKRDGAKLQQFLDAGLSLARVTDPKLVENLLLKSDGYPWLPPSNRVVSLLEKTAEWVQADGKADATAGALRTAKAGVLVSMQRPKEALQDLEAALEIEFRLDRPESAASRIGVLIDLRNRMQLPVAPFLKTQQARAKKQRWHRLAAELSFRWAKATRGDAAKAAEALREVIDVADRLGPDADVLAAQAEAELALQSFRLEKIERALDSAKRALRLGQGNFAALNAGGTVLAESNPVTKVIATQHGATLIAYIESLLDEACPRCRAELMTIASFFEVFADRRPQALAWLDRSTAEATRIGSWQQERRNIQLRCRMLSAPDEIDRCSIGVIDRCKARGDGCELEVSDGLLWELFSNGRPAIRQVIAERTEHRPDDPVFMGYRRLLDALDDKRKIVQLDRFVKRLPRRPAQRQGYVYMLEAIRLGSFEKIGDAGIALEAAERQVAAAPNDLTMRCFRAEANLAAKPTAPTIPADTEACRKASGLWPVFATVFDAVHGLLNDDSAAAKRNVEILVTRYEKTNFNKLNFDRLLRSFARNKPKGWRKASALLGAAGLPRKDAITGLRSFGASL